MGLDLNYLVIMEGCVFCKIIKNELPSNKEYEDDCVLAFRTLEPVAPVHILVIPKKHIANLSQVDDSDIEVLGKCQIIAKKLADRLGIQDAFRLLTASGSEAGQSVFHLHYHLIGGWKVQSPKMESEPGGLKKHD